MLTNKWQRKCLWSFWKNHHRPTRAVHKIDGGVKSREEWWNRKVTSSPQSRHVVSQGRSLSWVRHRRMNHKNMRHQNYRIARFLPHWRCGIIAIVLYNWWNDDVYRFIILYFLLFSIHLFQKKKNISIAYNWVLVEFRKVWRCKTHFWRRRIRSPIATTRKKCSLLEWTMTARVVGARIAHAKRDIVAASLTTRTNESREVLDITIIG